MPVWPPCPVLDTRHGLSPHAAHCSRRRRLVLSAEKRRRENRDVAEAGSWPHCPQRNARAGPAMHQPRSPAWPVLYPSAPLPTRRRRNRNPSRYPGAPQERPGSGSAGRALLRGGVRKLARSHTPLAQLRPWHRAAGQLPSVVTTHTGALHCSEKTANTKSTASHFTDDSQPKKKKAASGK